MSKLKITHDTDADLIAMALEQYGKTLQCFGHKCATVNKDIIDRSYKLMKYVRENESKIEAWCSNTKKV